MMAHPQKLRLVDAGDGTREQARTDEGLMRLIGADDLQAFTRLVSKNEAAVRRFCFGMLGNRAVAEEVAQETFLKIWLNRKNYRPKGTPKAYLFCIARNLCISKLRRKRILTFVGLKPALEAEMASESNAADLEQAERDTLLYEALRKLPPKLRSALLLRFMEEMSYDEIAEVSGRTPSAIRSRVHFGLKALADHLPEEVRTWNA